MAVLRDSFVSQDFVQSIVFHPGDKIDSLATPSAPEGIVGIASIVHNDGSGGEVESSGDLHIRNLSLAQNGELRKVSIMVQEQVQFDRSFGPSEMGPVKDAQTQIDGGRIEADQLVLKPKFLSPSNLHPTPFEQLEKHSLIELPGTVFIGIGQGRTIGSGNAQMFQFPLTAFQPSDNLSEGMGSAQLTEKHGHKLSPAGESPSVSLGSGFSDCLLELDPRKQL
jgi:hypothetical protein